MKKLVLTAVALTCAASVFAQGTVAFNNRVVGAGTSHVYAPLGPGDNVAIQGNAAIDGGSTSYGARALIGASGIAGQYGAAGTFSVLLAAPGSGQPESSLLPGTPTTTFRTGGAAGNIVGVTETLAGVPLDAPSATLQMFAWDNSSGSYNTYAQAVAAWNAGTIAAGKSLPFNLAAIGGTLNPPPNVEPALTSFNLYFQAIPEPSSMALAGLGAAALFIFRRRK